MAKNYGFLPFGFACGLRDRDTGLERFGVRDYDCETGRWTAKDPIGFDGGKNFHILWYNPINFNDSNGLAYFAKRRLIGDDYAIMFPLLDFFDLEILHEAVFFEDGKSPTIAGYYDSR